MIDAQVIISAKQGEQKAYTKIYQETYQSAYGVALQLLKNADDAADVLQDSYITAFTKLDTLEDNSKFQGWFNRIVANNCKNLLKKKKPTLFSELTVEEDGEELEPEFVNDNEAFCPDKTVEYDETKEILRKVINSLPEEQALCIMMYYVQDLSISEIAETLGVSQNTVKSRLNYGRKKMKTELEEMEKKGVCFYGVTGFALIPFIKWMFAEGAGTQIPNVLPKVFSTMKAAKTAGTVAQTATVAKTTAELVAQSATTAGTTKTAVGVGVEVAKGTAKRGLVKKVIAGILSVALFSGGLATGVIIKNNDKIEETTTETQGIVENDTMQGFLASAMSFEGYNGYGKISDVQQFIKVEELSKALCETDEDYATLVKSLEKNGIDILDYIKIDIDETNDGRLSNGDTVTVKIKVNYEKINDLEGATNKISGKDTYEMVYTVSGLQDIVTVDLYDGIEKVVYNCVTNESHLEIKGGEDTYTKDYGPCVVRWEYVADWVRAYITYTLPSGLEHTIALELDSLAPASYVEGGTLTVQVSGTMVDGLYEQDYCLESGFVFGDYTKEVVPDVIYSKLKTDSLAQSSFDRLKAGTDTKIASTQADSYTFVNAYTGNSDGEVGSSIYFVYRNNRTGEIACWSYSNCYVDQNGNILNVENVGLTYNGFVLDNVNSSSSVEEIRQAIEENFYVVAVTLSNK